MENKLMHKKPKGDLGFTLLEVLTVAAMISILATMAVVSMRGGRKVAFETRAIAAMKNIAENETIYYQRYREFGTWNELVAERDLIDPGYDQADDMSTPYDTPMALLYSIQIQLSSGRRCFTAIALPREKSIWHLRTYATFCDGSIMNSHDHGYFFSTLVITP